ncbi:hypothetical protein RRG08_064893 [Elysia crispata]|uniref:Uncharacterized protein n=1 Tax=Elysia crispata TaxID=231223 RepID=A0AAE0YXW4_9GAST|nr:hypothetical protein RRG08_064893 [Elysia crispata]
MATGYGRSTFLDRFTVNDKRSEESLPRIQDLKWSEFTKVPDEDTRLGDSTDPEHSWCPFVVNRTSLFALDTLDEAHDHRLHNARSVIDQIKKNRAFLQAQILKHFFSGDLSTNLRVISNISIDTKSAAGMFYCHFINRH